MDEDPSQGQAASAGDTQAQSLRPLPCDWAGWHVVTEVLRGHWNDSLHAWYPPTSAHSYRHWCHCCHGTSWAGSQEAR